MPGLCVKIGFHTIHHLPAPTPNFKSEKSGLLFTATPVSERAAIGSVLFWPAICSVRCIACAGAGMIGLDCNLLKIGKKLFDLLPPYGPKMHKAVLLRHESTITKQRQCEGMPQFPSCAAPTEVNMFSKRNRVIDSAKYLAACGDRTCRSTASIMRVFAPVMLGTVGSGIDAWPNMSPGAVVERLLL